MRQHGKYREAIHLIEPILEELKKPEYIDNYSSSLFLLGICYFELGQYTNAQSLLEAGLNIELSRNYDTRISLFSYELSLVAYREGKYAESATLCRDAIKRKLDSGLSLARKDFISYIQDDDINLGQEVIHLAILYQETDRFQDAKELLEIFRVYCERTYHLRLLGSTLNELGLIYFRLGDYADGVKSFFDSIEVKFKIHNLDGVRLTYSNFQRCVAAHPSAKLDPKVKLLLKVI